LRGTSTASSQLFDDWFDPIETRIRISSVCMISQVWGASVDNGSSIQQDIGIDRERSGEIGSLAHVPRKLARNSA
jgi:hypothetical protein